MRDTDPIGADSSHEVTRLRAALLPFARYASLMLDQAAARDAPLRDADTIFQLDAARITVGDLRRAVGEAGKPLADSEHLRAALAWYADAENYNGFGAPRMFDPQAGSWHIDGGRRARAALAAEQPPLTTTPEDVDRQLGNAMETARRWGRLPQPDEAERAQ